MPLPFILLCFNISPPCDLSTERMGQIIQPFHWRSLGSWPVAGRSVESSTLIKQHRPLLPSSFRLSCLCARMTNATFLFCKAMFIKGTVLSKVQCQMLGTSIRVLIWSGPAPFLSPSLAVLSLRSSSWLPRLWRIWIIWCEKGCTTRQFG